MPNHEGKETITITCPNCGASQRMTVWLLVDSEDNPTVVKKLLSGKLFEKKCTKCGVTSGFKYPVVYMNHKQNTIINYVEDDMQALLLKDTIAESRKSQHPKDRDNVRVVNSINSFREKVNLCEKGLDDRIVELEKVVLIDNVLSDVEDKDIERVLCWVNEDGTFDFDIFGKHEMSFNVKPDLYHDLTAIFGRMMRTKYKDVLDVDLDFAIDFVQKTHFKTEMN